MINFIKRMQSSSPVADRIRHKLTQALSPIHVELSDDSAKHAHHRAMKES